jgi:low affinity Fe/Cu permease
MTAVGTPLALAAGRQRRQQALNQFFRKLSQRTSNAVGSPWAFLVAALIVIVWATTGPLFRFSDTWQLVINTGTTIVTFLMVFLIQNSQNRDFKAMNLKLDELIRGTKGPRTEMVALEEMSDDELERLHKQYVAMQEKRLAGGQVQSLDGEAAVHNEMERRALDPDDDHKDVAA